MKASTPAKTFRIAHLSVGGRHPLVCIAGPCVIEDRTRCLDLAGHLARWAAKENVPLIFKASYDKANRTSVRSFRGPGIERGLAILEEIKERFQLPILTDVHEATQVVRAATVADVIQIPAFLCRQTDLLVAAGESRKAVNIKKGQFVAPEDMAHAIEKVRSTGNRRILLTERGTFFGYHNLVADMRNLLVMNELGPPVVFDATHSVQRPGGAGDRSGGDARWVPALARAAVATGVHAVFIETYIDPERALSDGANALRFRDLPALWRKLEKLHMLVNSSR